MRRKALSPSLARRAAASVVVCGLIVAACGNTAEPVPRIAETKQAPEAPAESGAIRFALPSEPLWQWLSDSGALSDWEAQHGRRIEASHPFRPFTALISGHADIILIDALDVPAFSQGLGSDPVIIGKYSTDRSIAAVKRTSQATNLAEVVEGRIAMESQLGSTLLWSLIVEQAHALDLSYDSRDFEYFIATFGVADTVDSGDAEACICEPDQGAAALSAGLLRPLYDGQSAAQLYAEQQGTPDQLLLGEVFLVEREWYRAHPQEVSAFLELWETAIGHWQTSYPEIIATYPEFLSLQNQEHVDWLTHYVTRSNWIAPTVYLTEADARTYTDAVDKLKASGQLPADAQAPSIITNRPTPAGGP